LTGHVASLMMRLLDWNVNLSVVAADSTTQVLNIGHTK
jgi:hypothetical protein